MSAVTHEVHMDRSSMIKWLATILLSLIPFIIPQSEIYTTSLQIFFSITLFCILLVAFDFFDALIPALILPTLYLLSGIVPAEIAFGAWTSTTVWMILGAMVLANALEESGLLPRIAYWCILKCGASFTGVMFGVYLAGVALNFITFCQAFIIMMVLGYGIILALNLKPSKETGILCFATMLGGQASTEFLYNPNFLAIIESGMQQLIPGFKTAWYEMLIYNGIQFFLFLGILWGMSIIFKTKNIKLEGGKEYFIKAYSDLGPISKKEKIGITVVLILMIFLFTSPLHNIPAAYGFMTLPYILFLPNLKVATQKSINNFNFSIFFFMVSCLGIGLVGGTLGFGHVISNTITPILEGASPLISLVVMLVCGMISNFFMTPYAMVAGLSVPFAQVCIDLGLNPLAGVMSLIISADLVFFPYEVATYLLMFSFGMISMKDFLIYNIAKIGITFLFFIFVMYPFWKFFGLL